MEEYTLGRDGRQPTDDTPVNQTPGPHDEAPRNGASGAAVPATSDWPPPMGRSAFHGLAGDIVRALEPSTEADPHALLTNALVTFGNAVGSVPHFRVGQDQHPLRIFGVLIGPTGHGRKGTSHAEVQRLFERADPSLSQRLASGLSTGEGLIWAVRDPIYKPEPIRQGGRTIGYEDVLADSGVSDKRLLVVEPELGRTLKVMGRDGNILSAVVRLAWDSGDLQVMTKNSPAKATGAHISLLCHVTREELLRYMDSTEAANGFGNRFLWQMVKRSKFLPDGGSAPEGVLAALADRLEMALDRGRQVGEMKRDAEATELWRELYADLSEGHPGLVGALTGRAEAQVMRLACIYALMDRLSTVQAEHLIAAISYWYRVEASVRHLFGDATGDPVADAILNALRTRGPMSQTEISGLFSRHVSAGRIARALDTLVRAGLVQSERAETGGRPTTVWRAV